MSFPRGSSRHSMRFQPRVVPHQTRAFHGSRAVSVSAKGVVANRLLSPHLPVKKPQRYILHFSQDIWCFLGNCHRVNSSAYKVQCGIRHNEASQEAGWSLDPQGFHDMLFFVGFDL
ncbi:hypothetical protein MUK42_02837 [Musa troglodytarum]|nr:hypothetical protein MUK42_02837 [Musa troglodytarum]